MFYSVGFLVKYGNVLMTNVSVTIEKMSTNTISTKIIPFIVKYILYILKALNIMKCI